MIKVSEEKLKELGFYKTNGGDYRKDYPAYIPSKKRSYSAFAEKEWGDEEERWVYCIETNNSLYCDTLVWDVDEKTNIYGKVVELQEAFEEFKRDMKELRKEDMKDGA